MKVLNPGNVKAVLFDAVGTLFDTRATVGELYHDVARAYGSVASAESIQKSFFDQWSIGGLPQNKTSWKTIVNSIFEDVGTVSNFDDFFEELYEVFRTPRGWQCFPETREVLQALKGEGYHLGVVSNFDERITDVLKALELDGFFNAVIVPSYSSYSKPDPRIFEAALRSLEVGASAALFVGDHLIEDVYGAQQAGIAALLILRDNRKAPPEVQIVSNLYEVLVTLNISTTS